MRMMYEEFEREVNKYIERLNLLAKINPELAKEEARKSLIETGVLNKDGSQKENIVTEPHVGNLDDLAEYYAEYNKKDKKYVKQRKKRKK